MNFVNENVYYTKQYLLLCVVHVLGSLYTAFRSRETIFLATILIARVPYTILFKYVILYYIH